MSVISVEAEYDGRVLVPRQPLNLQVGQRVRLIITEIPSETRMRLLEAAIEYFRAHPTGRSLTNEELRREVIYED
jgi:predicted DNA-binding antitoxin AbrB/MazE fold protein